MANEFSVEWDHFSSIHLRDRLLSKAVLRAFKTAGNDALRYVRAESKRQVRANTKIRAAYLAHKALPLRFAQGKAIADLVWRMDVSGKNVPLGEFPRRQVRRGVSLEIQTGKRVLLTSAFLAKSKNGRKGVFLRPTTKNYPMGHRVGMSVANAMANGRIPRSVLSRAGSKIYSSYLRLFPLEVQKLTK